MAEPLIIARRLVRADSGLTTQHGCFLERQGLILLMAAQVLGGRSSAERWIVEPARGLDHQIPYDLLSTSSGFGEVKTLILRIQYGVYI